jgi:hypothetical protein
MEGVVGIIVALFVFGVIAQIATAKNRRKRQSENMSLPTVLVVGASASHLSSGVAAAAFNKRSFKESEQPTEDEGALLAASKGL